MAYTWTMEDVERINAARARGRHGPGQVLLEREPQELDYSQMPKHRAILEDWDTAELLVSGSLNSGKTTLGLSKEVTALLRWPGIPVLLFRWTQHSVETKLRPLFEQLLSLRAVPYHWDSGQQCYHLANGSRAYAFGLKTQSATEQYQKIRGMGVHRILGDQVEEAERSVTDELRGRLRPDLRVTLSGVSYPYQLTFIVNPEDESAWISRQWPLDNSIPGRKVYQLSIYDNPYLPQVTIDSLLRTYPPSNPKHRTMILGLRGVNVVGDPVYEGIYVPELHCRPLTATAPTLLESFELGKQTSAWVIGQRTFHGALQLLGGCLGQQMALEDFLRLVRRLRAEWYGEKQIRSCATPIGEKESQHARVSLMDILRQWGVAPIWRDISNQPDVALTMIEELSSYLRRRTPTGKEESFAVSSAEDRWFVASRDGGLKPQAFLADALGGGYVWDATEVSVAHKSIRRPRQDNFYAPAMRAVENMLLSFCMHQPSESDRIRQQQRQQVQQGADLNPFAAMGPLSWMAL